VPAPLLNKTRACPLQCRAPASPLGPRCSRCSNLLFQPDTYPQPPGIWPCRCGEDRCWPRRRSGLACQKFRGQFIQIRRTAVTGFFVPFIYNDGFELDRLDFEPIVGIGAEDELVRGDANIVPLDLDISRFGQAAPAGARRFTISSISLGGQNQTVRPLRDFFAPAQFFDMSDDEKLSRPSFEPMPAGER
jgi:hypothetical protein